MQSCSWIIQFKWIGEQARNLEDRRPTCLPRKFPVAKAEVKVAAQKRDKEAAAEDAWRQQHSKEQRKRRYILEGQAAQRNAKRSRVADP